VLHSSKWLRIQAISLATLWLAGCSEAKLPPQSKQTLPGSISAEELLAKLRTTYAKAHAYSDNALLLERGVSRSQGKIIEIPFTRLSLLFDRPNRYAISYEDAIPGSQGRTQYRIASDGVRIRSVASQLPGQIHEALAPREVTTDNFIPEPELRQAILQVALENLFPQLAMLLASDAEKPIFPRANHSEMLSEKKIGDVVCYRMALTEPEGNRILWIDKEKFILRRMEIPIEGQREALDPTKQFTNFSVDLDFEDVAFNPEFDKAAVTVEITGNGRLVRRFVPPPSAGPSEELGKPVKDFVFTDATGAQVTPATLVGKICVFDFWSTDCPPCKEHTPVLEAAYRQLKDTEDIAFYGVSTDPKGLATDVVEKTLQAWGATFPLLRDLDKYSFYSLDVRVTPTLMLLGPDGRLQGAHIGMLTNADELVKKIRQISAGEDLVRQAREEYAKQVDQHAAILNAATIPTSLVDEKPPAAEIAPRKPPENLQTEELWQSKLADVTKPGDVAVLQTLRGEPQEILVLDGGAAVVRFDAQGKHLTRIELPAHQEKENGFVRTAIDAEGGRWFLVSGVGWQQVYVYDKDWKLVFAFPDEPHSGIGEARLCDLKSVGAPSVLVGYWGGLGVQVGSLEGQRLWVNRHLDHVLDVASGPAAESAAESLWCTSTRGTVFEIDADGKSLREFAVVGRTMISLEPQSNDQETVRCGISVGEPGQYTLVAFNKDGEVAWDYSLPSGEFLTQIPSIKIIDLPGQENCRLVVGPDGSLHFLSARGDLIDRFDYGEAITGLATVSTDEGLFLWVSAGERLTAWRITAKSAP
jgi:thiol-disulfide isomerase/thioredoxin